MVKKVDFLSFFANITINERLARVLKPWLTPTINFDKL